MTWATFGRVGWTRAVLVLAVLLVVVLLAPSGGIVARDRPARDGVRRVPGRSRTAIADRHEPAAHAPRGAAAPARSGAVVATGRVVDGSGRGLCGLRLLAIPPGTGAFDAPDPRTPVGADLAFPFVHADAEGRFTFRRLPEGRYRVFVDHSAWTAEQRTEFTTGARDLLLVAHRVLEWHARVLEFGTDEPVPAFTVRYRDDGEKCVHGRTGRFRIRQARATGSRSGQPIRVRVEAPGFRPASHPGLRSGINRIWLVRERPPNVEIRAEYHDGETDGDGIYRAGLPAGEWAFALRPENEWFGRRARMRTLEVPEAGIAQAEATVPRGGVLRIEGEHPDGRRIRLVIEGKTTYFLTAPRIDLGWHHVPPGKYSIRAGTDWRREIEVAHGSRHELVVR